MLAVNGEKIKVAGRLFFLVRSRSEDGWHCVDLEPVNDEWPSGGCTCRGYTVRKECRHMDVVRALIASLADD